MINHGFIRVAAAIPSLRVADCTYNSERIKYLIDKSLSLDIQVICFPELSVTGYTCGDLFHQNLLLEAVEKNITLLMEESLDIFNVFIIGAPVRVDGKLFNCAIAIQNGCVLGVVPKTYLPNYNEFYEKRWFTSSLDNNRTYIDYCGDTVPFGNLLFKSAEFTFGVEICEDLWAPVPPSSYLSVAGAHVIFNLSASNELIAKDDYRKSLILQQSARCMAGYVYASAGWEESTTDLVYTGSAFICENGSMLAQSGRFVMDEQLIISEIDIERLKADRQKNTSFMPGGSGPYRTVETQYPEIEPLRLSRPVNPLPFVPTDRQYDMRCEEIFSIQIGGLAKRLHHTGIKSCVIGISGGLDSTLALLVCVKTYDKLKMSRKDIIGITMPGYGTTGRTYKNALNLMESLGISIREIDIKPACEQHFKDIGHDPGLHNVVFENTQARERTQLLMDIANQNNALVIGTGDMSELALGWATYNGDHMSMYGINSSIPKTLVRHLVKWIAETQLDESSRNTLMDILDTPVSPELLPASNGEIIQKTEDIVGPYELHDFFLYYLVRFGFTPRKIFFLARHAFANIYHKDVILRWMKVFYKRFFSQQFKRSCLPDGPKVGSVNLSPRGDWRMPSDAGVQLWLKDLEEIDG